MIKVLLNKAPKEKKFPKLMVDNGLVVLFYEPCVGTCINPGKSANSIGSYRTDWYMLCFTDYNDPITIQNA